METELFIQKTFINMKKIQKAVRILFSPIIFILSFAAMLVLPGWICLSVGVTRILAKAMGIDVYEPYKDLFITSLTMFWFPFANTEEFIVNADLL